MAEVKKPATPVKPASKPAAKSASAKPAAKASAKPAAKSSAKPAVKASAPAKPKKVHIDPTDAVKTALWNSHDKAKTKKIKDSIAIQIYAEGLDQFYIAAKDGALEMERFYYEGNNGHLRISEKDLIRITKGDYDIIAAVKAGDAHFEGNLAVLLKIIDLF